MTLEKHGLLAVPHTVRVPVQHDALSVHDLVLSSSRQPSQAIRFYNAIRKVRKIFMKIVPGILA